MPTSTHPFLPVAGHPDDDECTHREDGTDATYCGMPAAAHGDDPALPATGYVWRPSLAEVRAAGASGEDYWPWRHVVVYCDRCGVEASGDMPTGDDGTGAIPALRALLATRGWRIDAAGDVCPGCVQAQAREAGT